MSLIDHQLVITDSKKVEVSWYVNSAECHYSRNSVLHFPKLFPELAIKFRNVDDCVYFTQALHLKSHVVWVDNEIPKSIQEIMQNHETKNQILYVFNMVGVKHIAGIKRGARVKSIAIASKHPWVHVFKVFNY